MSAIIVLIRAWKLKRCLKRLELAKANALRVHHGERPRYPWYEECFSSCVGWLRDYVCSPCCPCCVAKKKRRGSEGRNSDTYFRKPCSSGSYEGFAVKSLLGFMSGAFLTVLLFIFLSRLLSIHPLATTAICCVLGLLLTQALAFSPNARCITLMALPSLFSSRGRMVLLMYICIVVMSGPAKNSLRNANILVNTLNCGQEVLIKETKSIMKDILAPLNAVVNVMRDILKALKEFANMLKAAFLAIRDLFLEIINTIKSMFDWLRGLVDVCNSKYGSPFQRCRNAFQGAIDDCRQKLGVFKFLCEIVKAVQQICHVAKIVDLLCMIPKAIKFGIIEPLKEHVRKFTRYIYCQFYVNATFVHYYNYSLEQSKTFEEIRGDIGREIEDRTSWMMDVIDWSDLSMAFFFALLICKSYLYRIRYLTADHFDNYYITLRLQEINDLRAAKDKETILPLSSSKERRMYVHPFSLRMVRSERSQYVKALVLLVLSGLHLGFYLMVDYALYSFLLMVRSYGEVSTFDTKMPNVVQVQVQGRGVLADMYRKLVNQFDPLMKSSPEMNLSSCLPDPIPPNFDKYKFIGLLYLACLVLSLTESYGLRLRHMICGSYYPQRDKERAVWLYNHILRTRGGLKRFLKRRMYGVGPKVSFVDWLSAQSTWIAKVLKSFGYSAVSCIECAEKMDQKDPDSFRNCDTPGCTAVYCSSCFESCKVCSLCMVPMEYEEDADFSEEKDSSDEEAIIEETSDDESIDYQYEDRATSFEQAEPNEEKSDNAKASRSRRELVKVEDFSDDSEEDIV